MRILKGKYIGEKGEIFQGTFRNGKKEGIGKKKKESGRILLRKNGLAKWRLI